MLSRVCGRFTLGRWERQLLAKELGVPEESLPVLRPRYNIAPTDEHVVVRIKYETREALPARWGLVNSWAKDASRAARQINARSEHLLERPAFRDAYLKRRCVVPADGFYEWTGPRERRQPYWFSRADGGLLLFAGLYESWQEAPGQWLRTFTVITTAANDLMSPYHDRMPALIPWEQLDGWLDPGEPEPRSLLPLLGSPPEDLLVVRPVSPAVNSVRNDHPGLVEPIATLL
jgi:putative SOS response-associated peptidase YedK